MCAASSRDASGNARSNASRIVLRAIGRESVRICCDSNASRPFSKLAKSRENAEAISERSESSSAMIRTLRASVSANAGLRVCASGSKSWRTQERKREVSALVASSRHG
jgi:hypothetical protein